MRSQDGGFDIMLFQKQLYSRWGMMALKEA
jgi:hypothetical protein